MIDTPMDNTASPDSGNPFASQPTTPEGIPRISIFPPQQTQPTAQVGQAPTGQVAPSNADVDTTGIDTANTARYSDNFVDKNGVYGDTYKYLGMRNDLLKRGASPESTAVKEQQAVEADGLNYDDYTKIVGKVPTPQPTEAQAPASDNQADEDAMHKEIIRADLANNRHLGTLSDLFNAFDVDTLKAARPIEAGMAASSSAEAAGMLALGGGDEQTVKALEQLGHDFITNPEKAYVPAEEFFNRLGIQPPDPDSYMTDAGHAVWSTIATALATMYGVSEVAYAQKMRGVADIGIQAARSSATLGAMSLAAQKWSQAIAANPALYAATEGITGLTSTIGGEEGQDYATAHGGGQFERAGANIAGSFAGGLVGGAIAGTGQFVQRQSTRFENYMGKKIGDYLARNHPFLLKTPQGRAIAPKPTPAVDEDTLNAARAAEKQAREAGDKVVESAQYLRGQVPGTTEYKMAEESLRIYQDAEHNATRFADSAWAKLPAEVREGYSREQSAIRSQFSAPAYPKQFAADQVQAEQQAIESGVQDVLQGLAPADRSLGLAGQSAQLSQSLWQARSIFKGALNKFWNRTPLNSPMPNSSILNALDGPNGLLPRLKKQFDEQYIPMDEIARLQERFSMDSVRKQGKPTLSWLKTFMTGLHDKASIYYAQGNNQLAANYSKLESVLFDQTGQAFPDNIPLQQARAVSRRYFQFMENSDLGRFMQRDRSGNNVVHPEDVAEKMLRTPRAFRDITDLTQFLTSNGARISNIKDPMYLSNAQRTQLQGLRDNSEQSIRQHVQEFADKVENDPVKVAAMLNNPAFQRKIAAFGNVAGDMRGAIEELSTLMDRRQALAKSAFAKYAEKDPDRALDMVFKESSDPAKVAKELMEGTAGLGGFKDDPLAMEGFRNGIIDRFVDSARGDPVTMQRMLSKQQGRLMQQTLGTDYNRFSDLVNRAVEIQRQEAQEASGNKVKVILARIASLRILEHVPEWMKLSEGHSMQQAAIVSGFAKDMMEGYLSKFPINERVRLALSNPAFERAMYTRVPTDRIEAKELQKHLNKAITFERSAWGSVQNWLAYGNGPGQTDEQQPSSSPLSFLNPISSAQAATTQTGEPFGEIASRRVHHNAIENPLPANQRPPFNFGPPVGQSTPFHIAGDVVKGPWGPMGAARNPSPIMRALQASGALKNNVTPLPFNLGGDRKHYEPLE